MTDPGRGFDPATGDGAEVPAGRREAELRTAYEGLLQIRRLVNGPAGAGVPAPWEVARPARAVAPGDLVGLTGSGGFTYRHGDISVAYAFTCPPGLTLA